MPNAIIYNPLIKKGFQELADTDSIEAEITQLQTDVSALQQQKITKVTDAAQLDNIALNEIFEWQTDNATIDGTNYINGYFYKKIEQEVVIPVGSQYIWNIFDEIHLNDYDVILGEYYITQDLTAIALTTDFREYNVGYVGNNYNYYFIIKDGSIIKIGDKCFNSSTDTILTVTNVQYGNSITLDDGTVLNYTSASWSPLMYLYKTINTAGDIFYIASCSAMNSYIFLHYTIEGSAFNIIDWLRLAYIDLKTTTNTVTIGSNSYAQINTQPLQLSVNNNKVIYTLSDGITKKTLVSTDDISNTEIDYIPDESALKNGLPTTAPLSDIATLLSSLAISYNIGTTDTYVFFADATDYYTSTTSVEQCGFIGLVCSYRGGGNMGISVSLTMTALVSRNTLYYLAYSANDNKVVPILAQYNNRYYLGLKFASSLSRSITFIGKRYGFLSTPITATNNVTDIITGTKYT